MKITILDGQNTKENTSWAVYMQALVGQLQDNGHDVQHILLMDKDIHTCTGCFGCWVKTPGTCVIADDGRAFAEALYPADLVVIVTRIPFGSYAPSVKRVLDRSIPVLLPFFTVHEGEMHHVQRSARRRRVLHAPYGDYGPKELETFLGLARAHCDNMLSPRAKRRFEYVGEPRELAAWVAEEVGA